MRNFRLDDESGHQEALFEWAAYHMDCMPELEYMHHIPNGGKRDKRTAVALKRQGVKAGVPDICLPVARNGYHRRTGRQLFTRRAGAANGFGKGKRRIPHN